MIRSILTVVALIALSATACADDGNDGTGDGGGTLEGVPWVLQRSSIDELVADAPADARVDLVFEAGAIAGQAACNRYGGPTRSMDPRSRPATVLHEHGHSAAHGLESAYLEARWNVDAYEVARKSRFTGGDVRLAFDVEAAQEPLRLDGTAWSLRPSGPADAVSRRSPAPRSPPSRIRVGVRQRDATSQHVYETDGATISSACGARRSHVS
jgi:hypothetical protein